MKKKIGMVIVKTYTIFTFLFWTLFNRLLLGMLWNLGRKTRFEGVIYIPAVKGDITVGNMTMFGPQVRVGATENAKIVIGDRVSINQGSFIISRKSITIGNDCRIGEFVSIRDNDHNWLDSTIPIAEQGFITESVIIGSDVWIGRCVTIGKGVKIGDGCIIGAGAVVTKNIPPFSVAVGCPARVIKSRSK
ncbi:acyltransferase [Serratia fonticola]|uniref:acyltransferase n=1 Tax=Serratia fonticola TaxID=47917 RepID=UPI0021ADCDBC|nr:acyltransferase [Serratia fonticola]